MSALGFSSRLGFGARWCDNGLGRLLPLAGIRYPVGGILRRKPRRRRGRRPILVRREILELPWVGFDINRFMQRFRAPGRTLVAALLVLMAFPWTIVVAVGAEPHNPQWQADPPGVWRKMTWDDQTSTSTCIGRLISPICTVETKLAGFVRERNDLFAMTVFKGEGQTFIASDTGNRDIWYAYRISAARLVTVTESHPLPRINPKPGDYVVDLIEIQCWDGSEYCQPAKMDADDTPPITHVVRKIGTEWRIISWNQPAW